jgi:hypothetical protein
MVVHIDESRGGHTTVGSICPGGGRRLLVPAAQPSNPIAADAHPTPPGGRAAPVNDERIDDH